MHLAFVPLTKPKHELVSALQQHNQVHKKHGTHFEKFENIFQDHPQNPDDCFLSRVIPLQKISQKFTYNFLSNDAIKSNKQTRWLYCVECPQYSTRRRSASNIHRSGMLRKNR